jgi:hypothetical protein
LKRPFFYRLPDPDSPCKNQKNSQNVKTELYQTQFVAEKFNGRHLGHDSRYPVKHAESDGNENNAVIKSEFFFVHLEITAFPVL